MLVMKFFLKIIVLEHIYLTHTNTPILGVIYHHRLGILGFDTVYLCAKFDDSSISGSRDIIGGTKI